MKELQLAVGGDVLDRRQAGKAADERAEQVRVAVGEVGAGRGQVPLELIRPQRGRRGNHRHLRHPRDRDAGHSSAA
jgi:hypothetical protein